MKTLTDIQENYLAIDFFMSMSCNKDCHYCTSYTLEMRNLTVDMVFLKQTLEYLKKYKDILTIGIAFSFQKHHKLPVVNNDVKLNYILTEKGIF